MSIQEQAKPADILGVGIAFAAAGLYFMLVAGGALPPPGGDDTAHGPPVIVLCAGLAFLFAGLTCVVRARAGLNGGRSETAESAPRRTKAACRILAIATAGALATIGTWIAIGSGPRAFSLPAPFIEMSTTGEAIGRAIFALGAIIVWIYAIALTVGTTRQLFDRDGD